MAATTITNLSGLDAVDGITAADEALIKDMILELSRYDLGRAVVPMLFGSIGAEGFANTSEGEVRVQLTATEVLRVNFIPQGANKIKVETLKWVDGAWQLAVRLHTFDDVAFSAYTV